MDAEKAVLEAIQNVTGRGKEGMTAEQQRTLDECVALLESNGGVTAPTSSSMLNGRCVSPAEFDSSGSFLAEKSVRSPRKLFIFII